MNHTFKPVVPNVEIGKGKLKTLELDVKIFVMLICAALQKLYVLSWNQLCVAVNCLLFLL